MAETRRDNHSHGACTTAFTFFYTRQSKSKCAPHPLCEWSPSARNETSVVCGRHTIKLHQVYTQFERRMNIYYTYNVGCAAPSSNCDSVQEHSPRENASINYPLSRIRRCISVFFLIQHVKITSADDFHFILNVLKVHEVWVSASCVSSSVKYITNFMLAFCQGKPSRLLLNTIKSAAAAAAAQKALLCSLSRLYTPEYFHRGHQGCPVSL